MLHTTTVTLIAICGNGLQKSLCDNDRFWSLRFMRLMVMIIIMITIIGWRCGEDVEDVDVDPLEVLSTIFYPYPVITRSLLLLFISLAISTSVCTYQNQLDIKHLNIK